MNACDSAVFIRRPPARSHENGILIISVGLLPTALSRSDIVTLESITIRNDAKLNIIIRRARSLRCKKITGSATENRSYLHRLVAAVAVPA
jgi:hypothetical protein